jgi:hypothetical protein
MARGLLENDRISTSLSASTAKALRNVVALHQQIAAGAPLTQTRYSLRTRRVGEIKRTRSLRHAGTPVENAPSLDQSATG